jgi:hypothetical protein
MPYAGHQLMLREVIGLGAVYWPNSKVKAGATAAAEARGSIGAWHDNKTLITDLAVDQVVCNVETYEPTTIINPATGKIRLSDGSVVDVPLTTEWIISRDCGVYQINIPARLINSPYEATLRTESLDPAVYMPVARANVKAAYELWDNPWKRDGKTDFRRWQPWVAYTSGWAMWPEAWAWHRDPDGNRVGPWVPSGRYLHQAVRAVANWHLYIAHDMGSSEAIAEARRLADYWGITKGTLTFDERHGVYWNYPTAPTEPPTAEPWGYPVPNDGF